MGPSERSHEDIYSRQQETDLHIERIDGKVDNILQMLNMRNQQSTEHRSASDKILEALRRDANDHAKSVWDRFNMTDRAIDRVRQSSVDEIELHKKSTTLELKDLDKEIRGLDGKLLALGGGMALMSFLLVMFAPIIQQQFLQSIPAGSSPQHYELRK